MEEHELTKSNFVLTDESESFLKETAKWAYFLSILGFITVGIIVLMALFLGTIMSTLGSLGGNSMGGSMSMMGNIGGIITVIYLIIAILYFFPVYYLFLFSSKAKAAFRNNNNELLNESFQYLKSHYKFIGIMALIAIAFYGIILLVTTVIGMSTIF